MKKTLYFLILILLIGCGKNKHHTSLISITFSEDIQELDPAEDFDIEYIPLEFNEECMIGTVSKIQIVDGRIFILDKYHSLNLFVFDLSGKFITSIGGRGGAPYEFDRPMNFCINKENRWIVIDDSNKQRLIYYDLDDYSFVKIQSTDFGYTDFHMFENGEIGWFSHGGIASSKEKDYFHLTDSSFNVKWSGYKALYKSFIILTVTDLIYELNKERYVYHQLFPTLYKITETGVIPFYHFVFKEHSFVSIDEIKKRTKKVSDFYAFFDRTEDITAYGIYDTDDFLTIMYECNKDNYIAIYNKLTNQTYLSSYYNFSVSIEDQVGFYPRGTTENQLITVIQPSLDNIKEIKNESLRWIIKNLEKDHNPILGLIKLKTN